MCALLLAGSGLVWADTDTPSKKDKDAAPAEAPLADSPVLDEDDGEDKDWEFTAGFDLWSEYIFRGVRIPDNSPMYNPSASFGYKGFSVWYWGAFGDSDGPDNTYEENDYGADYTFTLMDDKLSLTAGGLMYHYPDGNSGADTFEVYGIAALDVLLQPSAALYWDIDEFHGGFLTLGIGHSFDLGEMVDMQEPMAWSLDPSAKVSVDFGYNDRGTQSNVALNDLTLGLGSTLQITEIVEVHAGINYQISLDALNNIAHSSNRLFGNVGFSVTF